MEPAGAPGALLRGSSHVADLAGGLHLGTQGIIAAAAPSFEVVDGLLLQKQQAPAFYESDKFMGMIGMAFLSAVAVIFAYVMRNMSPRQRYAFQQASFIVFHGAFYMTTVATMIVVYLSGNSKWLYILLPVHVGFGVFYAKLALQRTSWEGHNNIVSKACHGIYVIVVLGLMQGIQIKMAFETFAENQMHVPEELAASADARPLPRYHCKGIDGFFEAMVFMFVSMQLLLEEGLAPNDSFHQEVNFGSPWYAMVMYSCATFGCVVASMAIVEIDYRTSLAAQQEQDRSSLRTVRHVYFRIAEFMLRILTILLFVVLATAMAWPWWVPCACLAVDYLVCVTLVCIFGGKEPYPSAVLLVSLPMVVVNLVQFVDSPGLSTRARTISSILVPIRLFELSVILILSFSTSATVTIKGYKSSEEVVFIKFVTHHVQWDMYWTVSFVLYIFFLLTYAIRLKSCADLHSAVLRRDVNTLQRLLRPEMVDRLCLDVNRYGPDGRTPLHVAAERGDKAFVEELLKAKADIRLRTERGKNTALHLAMLKNNLDLTEFLMHHCSGRKSDHDALNVQNDDGNTVLHLAAKSECFPYDKLMAWMKLPGVDKTIRNNAQMTVVDCCFQFDANTTDRKAMVPLSMSVSAQVGAMASSTNRSSPGDFELAQRSHEPVSEGEEEDDDDDDGPSSQPVGPFQSLDADTANNAVTVTRSRKDDDSLRIVHMTTIQEEAAQGHHSMRSRATTSADNEVPSYANVMDCGLASFMLSIGLGALGFLNQRADAQPRNSNDVKFDDFITIKELGAGAFGKVSLVKKKGTDEQYAMKTLQKAQYERKRLTDKAMNEQDILKAMKHPFIVGLHYAFHGPHVWILVMDYCENGDFMKLIDVYGSPGLALPELARYCGEVILAVEFLHSIPVIFRDLKPDNVVIDKHWRSRLTDFGLAKKVGTAKTFCGSTGYAAPEVMMHRGKQLYNATIDLYSFGVTLWVMLTGGNKDAKKPGMSFPPATHAGFRDKVKSSTADKEAIDLVRKTTDDDPNVRGTARQARCHPFFEHRLGKPALDLLNDGRSYPPPSKPSTS